MTSNEYYFFKAVEVHDIKKAAVILNVNEDTINKAIAKLEKDYNCTLYIRKSKPLRLTPAGQLLYEYLKTVIQLNQKLIQDIQGSDNGHINIGISYPASWSIVNILQETFAVKHPIAKIQTRRLYGTNIIASLKEGLVDFVVSPHSIYVEGFPQIAAITNIKWGIVIPSGMPQADLGSIDSEAIHNLEYVVPSDPSILNQLENHLGIKLDNPYGTYDSSEDLLGMLLDGFGAGFTTSNDRGLFESSDMSFIQLKPIFNTQFYVYSKDYNALDCFGQEFYDSIKDKTISYY
ncbi:MAG: LysR family transcriptional regulator [Saccharofermentans sp.]|nr:LysR family transcriptional regulator [Saccharofermentans sp.]